MNKIPTFSFNSSDLFQNSTNNQIWI